MDDRDDHLMRCFSSAFPSATRDEIRTAKTFEAIPGWDSLRRVNLLAILDVFVTEEGPENAAPCTGGGICRWMTATIT